MKTLNNTKILTSLVASFLLSMFVNIGNSQTMPSGDSAGVPQTPTALRGPSLALEIGMTTLVWGLPSFWIWREGFDGDTAGYRFRGLALPLDAVLLILTLGPIAEATSDYEGSYWNAAWIGIAADVTCAITYGLVYGFKHRLNNDKFNWPEFLALGAAPSVLTVFIYNQFLSPKQSKDHTMTIYPSLGPQNTASINFMMGF